MPGSHTETPRHPSHSDARNQYKCQAWGSWAIALNPLTQFHGCPFRRNADRLAGFRIPEDTWWPVVQIEATEATNLDAPTTTERGCCWKILHLEKQMSNKNRCLVVFSGLL